MSSRPYDRLLEIVGGKQAVLVEATGLPQSTISYWQQTGIIPPRRIPEIIDRLRARGYSVTAEDCVPSSEAAERLVPRYGTP